MLHLDPLKFSNFKTFLQNAAWGLVSLIEILHQNHNREVRKGDLSPRLRFDLFDFAITSSFAIRSQICDSGVTPRPFDLFHTFVATIGKPPVCRGPPSDRFSAPLNIYQCLMIPRINPSKMLDRAY